jgi:leader peptidase (prepilin peptidase)/N-methyltransferase
VFVGVVTPHLINGPIALFLLVTGRARGGRPLPFGPALLAGALIGLTTA